MMIEQEKGTYVILNAEGRPDHNCQIAYIWEEWREIGFEMCGEPGPTMEDLAVILAYIADQFPEGWIIKDGKIEAWRRCTKELREAVSGTHG